MKNNHYVNRTVISAILVMASMSLHAQNPVNMWLDSPNPAGIRQDTSVARTAYAEVYAGLAAGGFRQTWEAPLSWNAGARTYALVHYKDISLEGSFSFDQMQGDRMCGSMMVRPGYYPVDVLEFTPGKKNMQTYAFSGAISADVATNWRIGAGIDFTSANYSKRKDLRHSNYFLDFSITPGLVWHRGDFSAGFNLLFSKNSDTPVARQIGSKDTYQAFLDKGLLYGQYEIWDGSGIHLSEAGVNGFPVRELIYGEGIQLQSGRFYVAVDYGYGTGRVGEKQQVWFRFPSHLVRLDAGGSISSGKALHTLHAQVNWKRLDNNESVLDKYNEGGVTYYQEIASRPILHYDQADARVLYKYEDGANRAFAELSGGFRSSASFSLFPFINERFTSCGQLNVGYNRILGRFNVGILAGGRIGSVNQTSRQADIDSGVVSEPFHLAEWDEKYVEYQKAPRLNMGINGRCNIWRGMYVRLEAGYVRAFGISVLPGANRIKGEFALGYEF
ncbi:MAG: DUF6850 family outer membrane beta-barrel protein [Candidatus Cryptobacteroides sp.]